MNTRIRLIYCLLAVLGLPLLASEPGMPAASPFAGIWHLVPDRSTDLSPWRTLEIEITVNGTRIGVSRHFTNGNRAVAAEMNLDLSHAVSIVPVPMWVDNRNLGAYIGGDRTEHVRASWLDDGRILRTDADLVLDTQQGPRKVNILTDYKISPGGKELTIVELRSTRAIPIVYAFERGPVPEIKP